jgi:hypothetical protein
MKLVDLSKKIGHASNCEIIIKRNGQQIKQPQAANELEAKIKNEIIENFTVTFFSVIDNQLIIHTK